MKKTYTHCKLGLFAGLLIFHTLSSCVHTGRALGVGTSRRDLERSYAEQMKSSKKDYIKWIKPGLIIIVGGSLVAGGCLLYNHLSASYSEEVPVGSEGNETRELTTVGYNADNRTSIGGATQLFFSTTMGLVTALYANRPTPAPPVILQTYQEAISHVQKHKFSTESIEDYLNNKFNINDTDKNGTTILMAAAQHDKYEAVQFIVDKGANVNLPDNNGNTPLMYINPRATNSTLIYDFLLEKGADPCEKNKDGRWLKFKAGIKSTNLQEVLNKC